MACASVQLEGVGLQTAQGVALLHGIDMSVGAGERCAVVGPNGAGKSSLLGLISGRLRHTAGRVHVGQQPQHADPGKPSSAHPRPQQVATVG